MTEEQKPVFTIEKIYVRDLSLEVPHAPGNFRIRHIPEKEMGPVLGIGCANILFAYVRETVSDAVTRGGFPTVMLNPVNFDALYQQQQQKTATDSGSTIH